MYTNGKNTAFYFNPLHSTILMIMHDYHYFKMFKANLKRYILTDFI